MSNVLIITGDRDTHGKRDYTGAFKPEAETFQRVIPGSHVLKRIDTSKGMEVRKRQLYEEIDNLKKNSGKFSFSDLAFFMHGWANGIQCGLRVKDVEEFVDRVHPLLATGTTPERPLHILLYCCLTGSTPGKPTSQLSEGPGGDGGFADQVRDAFCCHGKPWVKVYSHTTAGHTTRNPYVRVFEGLGSLVGAVDANWLIRPPKGGRKSPLWSEWRKALWSRAPYDYGSYPLPECLKDQGMDTMSKKDARFFMPFMTVEELHTFLTSC